MVKPKSVLKKHVKFLSYFMVTPPLQKLTVPHVVLGLVIHGQGRKTVPLCLELPF